MSDKKYDIEEIIKSLENSESDRDQILRFHTSCCKHCKMADLSCSASMMCQCHDEEISEIESILEELEEEKLTIQEDNGKWYIQQGSDEENTIAEFDSKDDADEYIKFKSSSIKTLEIDEIFKVGDDKYVLRDNQENLESENDPAIYVENAESEENES